MNDRFKQMMFTPSVRKAQEDNYGRTQRISAGTEAEALTAAEVEFISARDSFYMATVNEDGWPYIQHRGGPRGFLHVLDAHTIGFADFSGNRQLISVGNIAANDRVALFLMDYAQQERLKILGRGRVEPVRVHPEWIARLSDAEHEKFVERVFVIRVESYSWNCSQHITPRYTQSEVEKMTENLQNRIAELEAQLNK